MSGFWSDSSRLGSGLIYTLSTVIVQIRELGDSEAVLSTKPSKVPFLVSLQIVPISHVSRGLGWTPTDIRHLPATWTTSLEPFMTPFSQVLDLISESLFTHFTRLYTTFWPIAPRERAHRGISTRTSIKAESARDAQVLITPLLATADPAQHQPPHWAATSGISHSLPSPRATAVRALFGSAALSCRHTGTHQSASTQQHILRELRSSPRSISRDGLSRKNKKSS
jgi:hypothetical protein